MTNTKHLIITFLMALAVSAIGFGCGGGDEETAEETPYIAEEVPVAEEATEDGECQGDAVSGCEDVDLELCEQVGCKIRTFEEQDYTMCFSKVAPACRDMATASGCGQFRGCKWVD